MSTKVLAGETFTEFAKRIGPRLRQALIARQGPEVGPEAAAEALRYGWENWDRIQSMDNPAGYLYRVGQSRGRKHRRPAGPLLPNIPTEHELWVEPALPKALDGLSVKQRTAVVLVHCFAWTYDEVGEVLGVGKTTVQNHVERGMAKLRAALEVDNDD